MTQFSGGRLGGRDARVALGPAPRIAVVKLGALGDGVYVFPLVSALKAFRPAARLTWIVEARLRELPALHPRVDEVVALDTRAWRLALRRGRWREARRGFLDFVRAVAGRFDVAIEVQGLLKSGAAAWLTRAPVRVGFAADDCRERGSAWLMTHHAPPAGRAHALDRNLGVLAALGAPIGPPVFEFAVPPAGEAWADAWEAANGGGAAAWDGVHLLAIHPGAGHPAKRWGLARCLALAERLGASHGVRAAVITGPEDRAAVEAAVAGMAAPATVAAPPTLGALAALLRRCRLVVAGDTGPLHLAAALGRPTVALYGPSDPVLAAPIGTGHRVIKHPCPCGWVPGPFFNRRCPDAPCMAAIEVGEVVEAVESALARD